MEMRVNEVFGPYVCPPDWLLAAAGAEAGDAWWRAPRCTLGTGWADANVRFRPEAVIGGCMGRPTRLMGAVLASSLVLAAAWTWYRSHPALWPEYRQANALIESVEQFKSASGHFPSSLSELPGHQESGAGPIYYQTTSGGYEIWFGRSLGESYVFESSSRTWR